MKRAKTITGLLWQNIALRWNGISKRGRTFLIVGLVLASAVALQFSACMFGACPGAAGPCASESPCDVPCNVDAAADDDEPCPYAAAAAAEAEQADGDDGDVPPCHAD